MTIQKLKDLTFDEITVLKVIESDTDLSEIFAENAVVSYLALIQQSKANKLTDLDAKKVRGIFHKIISTQPDLIKNYETILNKKAKKQSLLPRRFGKVEIEKEIAKQGGVATNAQRTALELNRLKNIVTLLNTRMVNDMLTDSPILDDVDYREIRSAIGIVEAKFKNILKKKRK